MKRITIKAVALCMMLLGAQHTQAQSLGDILGAIGGGTSQGSQGSDLISGLTSVFSNNKTATSKNIVGTWTYQEPAIVLSSTNVLTNAAAKVASNKIEKNLQSHLTKYGIKPGAMSITFNENGTFTEIIGKKTVNGKWQIKDKQLVITYGTVKPVSITTQIDGKNLMIVTKADKLLTLFKTFGAKSTNSTVSTITSLMKNVNGMQCGLTFVKK